MNVPVLIFVSFKQDSSNRVLFCILNTDLYSDLGLFHRCCLCVAALDLLWVQFFLVVFDPVCDAQEDAKPMQTVHVPQVRLSYSDQDLFRLGLAQDQRERLQKHLEVTFTHKNIHIIS